MKKVLTFALLALVAATAAFADPVSTQDRIVPEINASTASSALALLSGAVMMLRRKR